MSDKSSSSADVVELNVGGVLYTTSRRTLLHDHDSLLARWFGSSDADEKSPMRDGQGPYFIDRDGALFRYIVHVTQTSVRIILATLGFTASGLAQERSSRAYLVAYCSATYSTTCALVSSFFPSRSAS